jgi:hypothetical protein
VTEHFPVASSVQLAGAPKVLPVAAEKSLPVLLVVQATPPVGVLLVPASVSVTVAVQVTVVPAVALAGVQLTLVSDARLVTVSPAVPPLVR